MAYAITVTNLDTVEFWQGTTRIGSSEEGDTSTGLVVVAIRSMTSYTKSFRGNSGNKGSVSTWDISGTAQTVTSNQTKLDDWKGGDVGPLYAIDPDTPGFSQTVNITP